MQSTEVGTRADAPAPETTRLREEMFTHLPGSRFARVLISFKITINGTLVALSPRQLRVQDFKDLEVVGVIGTILGKEGMFAQCGWFGDNDLDWMWVRIRNIKEVAVSQDLRFRRGEPCVWLTTAYGDYAMALPHQDYYDLWEQTLFDMRSAASRCKMFEMWPREGSRPRWWDERWKDSWPFVKSVSESTDNPATGSKRKSPDSDTMDVDSQRPPPGDRAPGTSTTKWSRLQLSVDDDLDELPQMVPWEIMVNGGLKADRRGKNQWDGIGRQGWLGNE